MKNNCIMVDLDNTLVNFTQMFFDFIKNEFGYEFKEEDLKTYDFTPLFKTKINDDKLISDFFYNLYKYPTFYQEYYKFTNEYNKIVDILSFYKKQNYDIELHTKCSTQIMVESKMKFLEEHIINKICFDLISFDVVKGKEIITSTKNLYYDIIIDDSPFVVEYYLKNNKEGKVYLPVRKYNEFLLEKYPNRIEVL